MAKRKRSTVVDAVAGNPIPVLPPIAIPPTASSVRKTASQRNKTNVPMDLPISPADALNRSVTQLISQQVDLEPPKKKKMAASREKDNIPEAEEAHVLEQLPKDVAEELAESAVESEEIANEAEITQALSRPPPVNSEYLPLPWKGRLGYACLNTYLRNANPPVFSSRTCRIASILEHRHPLRDPSAPEHPTRNRPDKTKPADIRMGQKWVEALGLTNARDITKMVRWNERFGIRFMRLSSEMFPFASHPEYGYKLAPFASEALAEAGQVIADLGHRVTTHPGQFTQLGSPRPEVIRNAVRDLEYHDEMLSLLKLPEQQNRDAVMILHMGGTFGSKEETLQRFRKNYAKLSDSIKRRLVLENDDVGWSVHDLLPICQELNIPLVLDFHHHNIIFEKSKVREGTKDIMDLFPVIRETWTRKGITQKMHYSEQTPTAITPMQRRKHSPRVMTLPPCAPDMDLMIEAKDKEQAVFELMRTFKLPGYDLFSDMIPHVRDDENKPLKAKKRASPTTKKAKKGEERVDEDTENERSVLVPEEKVGMGGPDHRVYWPPGMEDWLRPKKRELKKKDVDEAVDASAKTPRRGKAKLAGEVVEEVTVLKSIERAKKAPSKRRKKDAVSTPSTSEAEEALDFEEKTLALPVKVSRRSQRSGRVNYAEPELD